MHDRAFAACTQNGVIENCSGNANGGSAVFTNAPTITDLEVNGLTQNLGQVALTGAASQPADGTSGTGYTCAGTDCTITTNPDNSQTCTSPNNNQDCVAPTQAGQAGPSGQSGPSITVNVATGTYTITPGGGAANGVSAGVQGISRGSNGANGGNAYIFGDAGNGGDGADGGTVSVTVNGAVVTSGDNNSGVVAASLAGNGGNGGNAYVAAGGGGNGGQGGFGGNATAQLVGGSITTDGTNSVGIGAFSQGGNGGNGGGGGGIVYSAGGGSGAGQAGTATVNTSAGTSITTYGDYGYGIQARSLGGGGGSGGGGFGAFYSGGGSGSTGGNGGSAIVDANSTILTYGNYANGIFAQSIGGGGGDAGTVIGLVALGGNGSAGGNGGTVEVTNNGSITTVGLGANAIEAQSIGGSGGNGASSGGLVSLGGDGSSTTTGGTVSVTNAGALYTYNAQSAGIFAQSIGGGGGNGGTSAGLFAAGGSGGNGADANTVTVTNSGNIETGINAASNGSASAAGSPGILAQSIGGGGGNGGGAIAVGPGFSAAFGGSGGAGGNGEAVDVYLDNSNANLATAYSVTTYGDNSDAVVAQSIGGGGGNGGFSVSAGVNPIFDVSIGSGGAGGSAGSGGDVYVATKGSLTTYGLNSIGILAQSLGGGGGNGGFAVAGSAALTAVSVAVGGSAGGGGSAGTVTVANLADITTGGANSFGILAQSLGGGGGNGGFAGTGTAGGIGVSVGIGGTGGSGGSASTVEVDSAGNIQTSGANSVGIAAQSIGGGGGNGGFTADGAIGAIGVAVGVGGTGGTGGTADEVTLNSSGYVLTGGNESAGILAQSIGGGGGNGGFAVSGSLAAGLAASVGVGGSGGSGQSASTVTINADGGGQSIAVTYNGNDYGAGWTTVTLGADSPGVEGQSIGGGGGNGGFSGTLALGGGAVGVSVGGSGTGGGDGGEVFVNSGTTTYANNIFTAGDNSDGVVAQSIGGGGGNGGFSVGLSGDFASASAAVTLGGGGGVGGNGSDAEATSIGNITTLGNLSDGVFVQSIGGGGGDGGFSAALDLSAGGVAGAVAIGGGGNSGGNAGSVSASSTGTIRTYGDQSSGIVAQSIGGGGGNGGFAGSGALGLVASAAVGVGGSGADGGNASTVNLTNNGDVTTSGNQSSDLIAQSIGGGGGNGGSTVGLSIGVGGGAAVNVGGGGGGGGTSDAVTVVSTGNLTTGYESTALSGNNAYGILAQSIGGGGGNGGFSGNVAAGGAVALGVSVGGLGGTAGDAGTVQVTSTGDIQTTFDNSSGIMAQSIGGSGGNGGFSFSISGSASIEGVGAAGAVSVGGFGGQAGDASSVTVTNAGTILTLGDNSNGIEAQSVGGGGGNGGFSIAGAFTLGNAAVGVSVGGFGDGGGSAGDVNVYSYNAAASNGTPLEDSAPLNTVTLQTEGNQSNGILAQSLGGGGGNGGFSAGIGAALDGAAGGISVGGFGSGGGDAGSVGVVSYNNILTMGSQSDGILAQSIGGGGGNGGFSVGLSASSDFSGSASVGGFGGGGGAAGAVTVDQYGSVETEGSDSNAIAAQSIGGGGGNGGFSISGAFTVGAAGVGVSVGGFGAGGGDASSVNVDTYWSALNGSGIETSAAYGTVTLSTTGDRSNGILAQSIGGGGGNGGFSASGALATGGAGIALSVGGFGGTGGDASTVDVTSYQNIATQGAESNGILAQSIGGKGGNGGFSLGVSAGSDFAGSVSVGGFGAVGGNADAVTVNSYGTISTVGDNSNGLVAQSIGGGGGNGGFSIAGGFTVGDAGLGLSVGGFGAGGGNAGNVTVDSYASSTDGTPDLTAPTPGEFTIATSGDNSNGILAESLGGGGGNGGFSASGAFSDTGVGVAASVGGFGGGAGNAGTVDVTSVQNISTSGASSNAIEALSVGGGGGNGGFSLGLAAGAQFGGAFDVGGGGGSAGDAGDVTVNSTGELVTQGLNSNGILAQSIGGAGGNGGFALSGSFSIDNAAVSASVGGFGGTAGAGGNVVVNSNVGTTLANDTATIQTSGDDANGIEAQSIGGGGGNGGFSGSFSASVESQATVSLSVGGFGAAGNSAGTVTVTSVDNILTSGDGANGILAQSIGGGGGDGGFSFAGNLTVADGNSLALSASLGGLGGTGGAADTVTVDSTGIISTSGDEASGTVAQSIGGGGGNGGLSVAGSFNFDDNNSVPSITASVGGTGGAGGAAGDVNVTRIGATTTVGDSSYGILAQSIGGGGGNGGLSISGAIGGPGANQITASVGGFGGAGNTAGDVTVNNTGAITTGSLTTGQVLAQGTDSLVTQDVQVETGNGSDGILAQSIGGGGGNGGFAFSGAISPFEEGETNFQVGLTVGGTGGSGATAGTVGVTNQGLITTYGANANGIDAQSIGGGGGNGGSAVTGLLSAGDANEGNNVQISASVGGEGGTGADAGDVTVNQTGGIVTYGGASNGILAQSIGGGGGNGGNANTVSLQLATSCTFEIPKAPTVGNCQTAKKPSVTVQVDVGGFGGASGNGGTVNVTNNSFITTLGSSSSGIVAQSIGGGGGTGGQAMVGVEGLFTGSEYVGYANDALNEIIGAGKETTGLGKITVGGFGGAAGDGSTVDVNNYGVISTAGDSSYGIEAQSIGGGGGNGGDAGSGVTGAVSVGGFGAASGAGGDVTVTNNANADIVTTGYSSTAILAQSIGGGGGDGGAAGGLVAVGGFGGASGDGGTVTVTNDATLITYGDYAGGIFAQSIGGGGGNGGGTGLSAVAIGGLAGALGSTGNGGAVTVTNSNTATILTYGSNADAIEAQSIGGGGGNGGGNTLVAAVTVGGHGGSAGNGGQVQVFNDGQLQTVGDQSMGIFAQSLGGSGGDGGGSIVSAVTVGGFGGSSGNGGEVDVANTGAITTFGAGSDDIRAQSIGGGGGDAGGVGQSVTDGGLGLGLLVSVGGGGGGGGNGGVVDVTNTNSGTLVTVGDDSDGIYAQSIGGGGGDGGLAIGAVAVGGSGGNTGNGGAVTVTNNGTIWTQGTMSDAIFAQSIGGGGGDGGGAYSGTPFGVSTSVGGSGSAGGTGGSVEVDNYGMLETDGASSEAIFAQSVGGGGGNGGIAGSFNVQTIPAVPGAGVSVGGNGGGGGDGGSVTVNNYSTGSIVTNGANSTAIFAQSVGGGGGSGGYAISASVASGGSVAVSVGGNGGAAGNGGNVSVSNAGTITINGNNSIAIMAQSVGGGGGVAADALGVAVVPVFIGGQNGASGTGGTVTVTNTGSIIINGNNSIGIFAQSVGGGGGLILPGGGATSVETESGGVGDGADVTITNTAGSIIINGDNSVALYTQSVGGGGGAVGLNSDPTGQTGPFLFSADAGGVGTAAPTEIDQTGNLIATGLNSIGLVAQSDAPGGNGNITVNINNPAGTTSLILGGLGSGAGVSILNGADNTLNNAGIIAAVPTISGTITGLVADEGTFTVTTGGGTSQVSGVGGYAVRGTDGNDTINNTGLMIGSVDLGGGVNAINNQKGGEFVTGSVIALGTDPADLFTNSGYVAPGGVNQVFTTDITGSLALTSTSVYQLDYDLDPATDRLNATGTATVGGTLLINILNPGDATPGDNQNVIIHADGGVTNDGLTISALPSAITTYSLIYDPNDVILDTKINFAPAGLDVNQTNVGNGINAIQSAQPRPPGFYPIAADIFYIPTAAELGSVYDSIDGEGISAVEQTAFNADDHFISSVMRQTDFWRSDSAIDPNGVSVYASAPNLTDSKDANGRPMLPRTWRAWVSGYGGSDNIAGESSLGTASVHSAGQGVAGGLDYQITPDAIIGIAGGGGPSSFSVPDRATWGTVSAAHIGLYGAYRWNAFYTTGILAFDTFRAQTDRYASVPGTNAPVNPVQGITEELQGNFSARSVSGRLESGYKLTYGSLNVTPLGALQFASLRMDGFTEQALISSNAGNLALSPAGETVGSIQSFLGAQIDTQVPLFGNALLEPWLRVSWVHEFDPNRPFLPSFSAAPGFYFPINGARAPQDSARINSGLKIGLAPGVSIYANFDGDFANRSTDLAGMGGFKVAW